MENEKIQLIKIVKRLAKKGQQMKEEAQRKFGYPETPFGCGLWNTAYMDAIILVNKLEKNNIKKERKIK